VPPRLFGRIPSRGENRKSRVGFIEPMLTVAVTKLPEGPTWQYELKFDGYRVLGIKANGKVRLLSRNGKDFTRRFASIARAMESTARRYRHRWRSHCVRFRRAAVVQRPAESSRRARAAPVRLRFADASLPGSDAGTARGAA
jgi:ATP dependent DNA ligase domain